MNAPYRHQRSLLRDDPLAEFERVAEARDPMTEVGRLLCLERKLTPAEWAFIEAAEAANGEPQIHEGEKR